MTFATNISLKRFGILPRQTRRAPASASRRHETRATHSPGLIRIRINRVPLDGVSLNQNVTPATKWIGSLGPLYVQAQSAPASPGVRTSYTHVGCRASLLMIRVTYRNTFGAQTQGLRRQGVIGPASPV